MIQYNKAFHQNTNPPTRPEFENWTIKARHEFIRREFGGRIKQMPKGVWAYLFYPESNMCVRCKLGKAQSIVAVETFTFKEGGALVKQTQAAVKALNSSSVN